MQHGAQKLFGALGGLGAPGRSAELVSTMGAAGVIEFFLAGLVLIGLFTRPAAFLIAGELAVAYFWRHAPGGFWPILNRGELAAIYSFVFLTFAACGPGPWSLDALLGRRSEADASAARDEHVLARSEPRARGARRPRGARAARG